VEVNFVLQAVNDKVKRKRAKGKQEKTTLHQSCPDCIYNHRHIGHNVTASALNLLLHEIMEHVDEASNSLLQTNRQEIIVCKLLF
jgi:hypothetical protein